MVLTVLNVPLFVQINLSILEALFYFLIQKGAVGETAPDLLGYVELLEPEGSSIVSQFSVARITANPCGC